MSNFIALAGVTPANIAINDKNSLAYISAAESTSGHFEGERVGTPFPLLKFPWNAWERRSPC